MKRTRHSQGNTIANRGYLFMCGRTYVIRMLTLVFLFLLRGLPLPIPPLNRTFSFSDPISFKEINYLPLCIRLFLNDIRFTLVLKTYCYTQDCAVIL